MFKVGIISVPEREEVRKVMTDELEKLGLEYLIFEDVNHKGQPYNFDQMLKYFCENYQDSNIILCTDDIIFHDGWLEKFKELLEKTDYEVLTTFTNKNSSKVDEFGVFEAHSKFWLYDVCVLYRKGVLNKEFYEKFVEFAKQPERIMKETNHYDNMVSHYLIDRGYKCGIIRPNLVSLQKVKSVIGHSIKDRENW